jgi:hypothetical protein
MFKDKVKTVEEVEEIRVAYELEEQHQKFCIRVNWFV